MIVLDTHVLVWATAKDRRLGRKARGLIDRHWASDAVAVAAISFWECAVLSARRRLRLPADVDEWRNQLLLSGLRELPLDGGIALRAVGLSGLPDDPADRFIVATALTHDATLLTADAQLLEWEHPLSRVSALG